MCLLLCLLVGFANSATIFRDGREVVVEPAVLIESPIKEAVVSELRKEIEEPVIELEKFEERLVEEVVKEEMVKEEMAKAEEEVVSEQLRTILEPAVEVAEPVAVVLSEKEVVSNSNSEQIVAVVEPEVPIAAVRNQEVESVVSELKSAPVIAVIEEEVPAPVVDAVKLDIVEEVPVVDSLRSVPIVEEPVEAVKAIEPAMEAVAEEKKAVVAEIIPEEKKVVAEEEVKEVVSEVKAEIPVMADEVDPVEGTLRQNAVEGDAPKPPTLLQQAQQVFNPITQFIQNNPITNAIRGGSTVSPTANDDAPTTTGRPGLFAQLFNPTTGSPALNSAEEPPKNPPNFIQNAISNIQSALPGPPAFIQNIFNGNRNNTAAKPPAAAEAAPAAVSEEVASNVIQRRIDTVEEVDKPAEIMPEPVPASVVASEKLDVELKEEEQKKPIEAAEAEIKSE